MRGIHPRPLAPAAVAAVITVTATAVGAPRHWDHLAPAVMASIAMCSAGICAGTIVFAAVLTGPSRPKMRFDGPGRRATAVASGSGLAGCVCATVLVCRHPAGRGYWAAEAVALVVAVLTILTARAWLAVCAAAVAALVGVCAAALALAPTAGAGQDIASNAAMLGAVAWACWLGASISVLCGRRSDALFSVAARRYRALTLICFPILVTAVVVGVAGRYHHSEGRGRGGLIVAAVALSVVIACGAAAARRRMLAGVAWTSVAGLSALGGTMVAVSATQVPANRTGMIGLIGYAPSRGPGIAELAGWWRFDLVLGSAAVVLAGGYVLAVVKLRRRGDLWPAGRTAAWLIGCGALVVVTSSGIGVYSRTMFSVYMVVHMALNMFVPVLLVLGGPVTLLLRVLPAAAADQTPGPREWILAAVHSPLARFLTRPAVAVAIFVVSLYGLYFTGIFASAVHHPWSYELMNVHFVLTGYLFYWAIIGIDPGPARPPFVARLGVLVAIMPFHAFFGVTLMMTTTVIAGNYYRALAAPWVHDLVADQHVGGAIAWVSGEVPLLVVVIALLSQWARQDHRMAAREDRHADRYTDRELEAYNQMLQDLARQRG